jgi:glutathione synthase/RimK-type ligase-like ATP-grasp enzyme
MKKIGFATYQALPQGADDDLLLVEVLKPLGIDVVPVVWDDPTADIKALDAIVVRSCWDYHLKAEQFLGWLDDIDRAGTRLFNSSEITRWNLDKHYLQDLAAQNVAIPRTLWVEQGTQAELAELLRVHGLSEAVVKPVISLSAYQTWRVPAADASAYQQQFEQLVAERSVVIQALIPEIATEGELSLMFFGKQYSHAVCKRPKPGDFRVQVDYGGTREPALPAEGIIAQAQRIVDLIDEPLLFARVDGIEVDGRLVLMELELIDPFLFFAYDQNAPQRFAEAIAQALERS